MLVAEVVQDNPTPGVFSVNVAAKGLTSRFGVKAHSKGLTPIIEV